MKIIQGDLIKLSKEGAFDFVVHGANCFCVMGKGFAKQIKEAYPEAYEADLDTIKGDKEKLGTYSSWFGWDVDHYITIINAYTQFGYGGDKVNVDYDAIRKVFGELHKALKVCLTYKPRIAYPKIGAGLAGGDWAHIARIIDNKLKGLDHTLVEYVKEP